MASRDKEIADTGLVNVKTKAEQDNQAAIAAAIAAGPSALNAATPMPILVGSGGETSRADAPGTTGYGPQPAIVTPDDRTTYASGVKMHDAQIQQNNTLWPVILKSRRQSDPDHRGCREGRRALRFERRSCPRFPSRPERAARGWRALHRNQPDDFHRLVSRRHRRR